MNHLKSYTRGSYRKVDPLVRFYSKTEQVDDCLLWTGATNHRGYGQFRYEGRTYLTHRWIYEQEHGPIPDGLNVLHSCDTPACVLLDHLRVGTQAENMQDRGDRGRTNNGKAARVECNHGHEYTPENTYVTSNGWRQCKTCNRERKRASYTSRKEVVPSETS